MLTSLMLSSFSKALNAYFGLDPESVNRLRQLDGKTVTIEWLPFHFIFQCHFTVQGVTVYTDELLSADVRISGTPLQMLNLMITKEKRSHLFTDELVIEGNAELGQQVLALFDELQWDGEEYLSRLIGDVPAYHAGRLLDQMSHWLHHTKDTLMDNVNEYLHEEVTWFPAREALSDFFADIDTLRMDVDRAEAKIKQLKATLNNDEAIG